MVVRGCTLKGSRKKFRFCYVAKLFFFIGAFPFTTLLSTPVIWSMPEYIVLAQLVLILRPYKRTSQNMIGVQTLFLMPLFPALSVTVSLYLTIQNVGPLHLPFLCLVGYLIYRKFNC